MPLRRISREGVAMLIRQSTFMRLVLFSILMLSLVAACGGNEDGAEETPQVTTDTTATTTIAGETSTADATAPGSPGGAALVPDTNIGTTVIALVGDGRVEISTSAIPVGPAVMTVTNVGTELHSLQVEGNGNSFALSDPIDKNVRNTLNVEFKQGTYSIFCPIAGHRERGEQTQITIPMS